MKLVGLVILCIWLSIIFFFPVELILWIMQFIGNVTIIAIIAACFLWQAGKQPSDFW